MKWNVRRIDYMTTWLPADWRPVACAVHSIPDPSALPESPESKTRSVAILAQSIS